MPILPPTTMQIITKLQNAGVQPILYGSQSAALYIGAFKKFGDIDLLVDGQWIGQDWQRLIAIMGKSSFMLHDEHEHDFVNEDDIHVGFASVDILIRDGITQSLNDALDIFTIDNVNVRTLRPQFLKKAYEFSVLDGYRKNTRGKKDRQVIEQLTNYLEQGSRPTS